MDSGPEDDLNGTYTLSSPEYRHRDGRQGNSGSAEQHVVDMPTTPRGVDAVTKAEPVSERRKSSHSKHGKHGKKKRHSKHKSPGEIDQYPHESHSLTGTYTIPDLLRRSVPGAQRLSRVDVMSELQPRQPTIESPPEARLSAVRRKESVKDQLADAPSPIGECTSRKLEKRKKRPKRDGDLGVELTVKDVCEYVLDKFHQKVALDDVDLGRGVFQSGKHPDTPHGVYRTIRTQAYGKISFKKDATSSYQPPYICLSNTDNKEDLLKLMLDYWNLPDPKLIVSIVGGAKRFQFAKNRISALFKQGLLDIATTTGAWILTPGSNTGVYKMVGSAVKDHIDATGSSAMNNIVLLGIASWGSVANRNCLADPNGRGRFPAKYPISEITGQKGTQPLDPNHSHFILVDDGTRDKFGGEIKWRAEFEKFLTEHVLFSDKETKSTDESDEVHIPLVTLLVNGGDGSLESCSESLRHKIPLVAIAGSGRAAEVVVLLMKHLQNKANPSRISGTELKAIYHQAMNSAAKTDAIIHHLEIIADHHENISVFDFIQSGVNADDMGLDRAILSALHRKDSMDVSRMKAQMRLALSWGRVDYARDDILDINNEHYKGFIREKSFLCSVAFEALVEDMPGFITLLVDNGLDLQEFVTETRLEGLYHEAMKRDEAYSRFLLTQYHTQQAPDKTRISRCFSSVREEPSDMQKIGKLIKEFLGYSYPNIYKKTAKGNAYKTVDGVEVYKDPAQQIFLWAVLFNRMEIARMFWRYSEDHIAGAIVAAAVLRGMARNSNHQEGVDITATYLNNSMKFETLANGILDCCWSRDRQYTSDMLVREAPNWGNATVLSMAYHGEMEEFLAQPACYTKLNKIWRGDIALRTPLPLVLLFAFVPFTAFLLTFVRKNDTDARMDERQEDPQFIDDLTRDDANDKSPVISKPLISVTLLGEGKHEISYLKAIYRAFRSPLVKCVHYSIFYTSFLIIYSLFLMTECRPFVFSTIGNSSSANSSSANTSSANNSSSASTMSDNSMSPVFPCDTCCSGTQIGCLEIATYAFALANLLEEIRQILFRDARSMKYIRQKFKDWLMDFWNQVDTLSYVFFVAAISVRFTVTEEYFEVAIWLYSFSLMVYFVRFSQIFFVVEQLGPKIIMIRKMLVDLVFFLVILTMTILAFGVISQSILHPRSALSWNLLSDVVHNPYFQMYGELFLDEFEGYRWILLGFYMLITNVLLLNLLIAMFSYSFEQVQGKSEILWKYNYYAVVYEHFDRPYLPLIGTLLQMLQRCGNCGCSGLRGDQKDFKRKLGEEYDDKITKFVKVCMEKYVNQEDRLHKEDMANKVASTAQRLEMVIGQLDDLRDDVVTEHKKTPSTTAVAVSTAAPSRLENRMSALESQLIEKLTSVENKLDQMMQMSRQHSQY